MLRCLLPIAAVVIAVLPLAAPAKIPEHKVKIGVLQDLPRPVAQRTGFGALVAAQLAASDFEKEYLKSDAEILPGALKSSAEADLDQVRDWIEKEHVAAVLSSAPAAVNRRLAPLLEQHHRTLLITTVGEDRTDEPCSGNVVVWGTGAAARARALVQALVPLGAKKWLLVGQQTEIGLATNSALQDALKSAGGEIVGTHEADLEHFHFGWKRSKPLVGEQSDQPDSRRDSTQADIAPGDLETNGAEMQQGVPQVVALTDAGYDLVRALRSAQLMGLAHRATLASPLATISEVDQAGAETAQGLVLVAPFYWNSNDTSRRFARRWQDRYPASHVSDNAALTYAATLSFLHAAKSVEDVDATKVDGELRRAPIKDTLFGPVSIGGDGRVAYSLEAYRVKRPAEIQERWDYLRRIATIPAPEVSPGQACAKS